MEHFTPAEAVLLLHTKMKPHISNKFDALFILLHAFMESAGFKLVGLGESENFVSNKEIPANWNASLDAWSFRYRHFKSSMTFLLKAIRLGNQLLVHSLAMEQNQILNLELAVDEYVSDPTLDLSNPNLYKNLNKLCDTFKENIMAKLVPSVQDLSSSSTTATSTGTSGGQRNGNGTSIPSRPPNIPSYLDPNGYDPLRIGPVRRPPPTYPPYSPFGIGGGDLYPSPGAGFGYIPGADPFTPFGGGSGSLIGPNHPGFGIRDPSRPPYAPGRGDFPFPPPPGARFDPFGPPGVRPNPDPDHFPPPGNFDDDMFM